MAIFIVKTDKWSIFPILPSPTDVVSFALKGHIGLSNMRLFATHRCLLIYTTNIYCCFVIGDKVTKPFITIFV